MHSIINFMKKLICFDLDGTLTQHRTPLGEESKAVLDALGKKFKLIMVGAGGADRINKQMNNYPIDIIGNYGMNEAVHDGTGIKIVKNEIYSVDKAFFTEKVDYLRKKYGYTEYKGDSIQFHNSGMVTFAILGTEADISDKVKFDPTRAKRKVMYEEVCEIFKDYTVYIGGSSSFDIVGKQYNKYDATLEYAQMFGYTKEQVLFMGDDMGDGGGDSHVRLGGMDYIHVLDYTKIPEMLAFLLE